MDLYDWVLKAIADRNLTPLRKLLSRRDLPASLRSSIEGYIEAEEKLRANPNWLSVTSSFRDFAAGKDNPIRYERGDPPPEGKSSRAVDRRSGEYVEFHVPHWQDPTRNYFLFSADGTKIGSAVVQQDVVDVSGDGKVGLYKVRVIEIRHLSDNGAWVVVDDASSPIAQKLAGFIAALWLDNPGQHSAEISFDLGGKIL